METYMWIVWTAILVIAVIVEAATTALVSVWFIGGAVLALILSVIPGIPWWGELIGFIGFSLVLFFVFRPWAKKLMSNENVESNIDEMVGKKGKMIKEATELDNGEVKIKGVIWTAMVPNGIAKVEEGKIVKVLAVEGNKLIVEETNERI